MKRLAFILISLAMAIHAAEMPPRPDASPVEEFRQWLKASPEEQKEALATRSPENRKILEEKLREYGALPADVRESKLNATEFRWYLDTYLDLTPEQRGDKIDKAPLAIRKILKERLALWDQIPTEEKKRMRENELTIQFLGSPAPEQVLVLKELDDEQLKNLEDRVAKWKALSPQDQRNFRESLEDFFHMPAQKQERVLVSFQPQERQAVARTLSVFRGLPEKDRVRYISAFEKFAAMRPDERMAFLHNVNRWQAMTPKARSEWSDLVKELSEPPKPPGMP